MLAKADIIILGLHWGSGHHLNGQSPAPILLPRCELMVPRGRVELPLSYENRILSPARLPVPPSGHIHSKGESS